MLERFNHDLHGDVLTLRKIHFLVRIGEREGLPTDASLGDIEKELIHHDDSDYFIGMGEEEDVAVVAHVSRNLKKEISVIEGIAVNDRYRGKGIGIRALQELVSIERAQGSKVIRAIPNHRCVGFFEKAGFTSHDPRRHSGMTRHIGEDLDQLPPAS